MTEATNNLIKTHDFGTQWLSRVNSLYVTKDIELKSHAIKKMFVRSYMKVNKDLHFLMTFAPFLIGDKGDVKRMIDVLRRGVAKANKTLDGKITQLETLLKNNGIEPQITATQFLKAAAPILTPISGDVVSLFIKADQAFALASLCWFMGLADDEQKRKYEGEVIDCLRTFLTTARTMMGTALNTMRKKEAEGTLPAEVRDEIAEASDHVASTEDADDASAPDAETIAQASALMSTTAAEAQPA